MLLYRVKRYLMLSLELLVVETKKFAKLGFDVHRYCHRRAALQRILCDGLVLIIQHKCEIFVA